VVFRAALRNGLRPELTAANDYVFTPDPPEPAPPAREA
jgi:hypothetical protein